MDGDRHQRRTGGDGGYQRPASKTPLSMGSVATNDKDVDDGAVLTYALKDSDQAPAGLTFNADGSYSFNAD